MCIVIGNYSVFIVCLYEILNIDFSWLFVGWCSHVTTCPRGHLLPFIFSTYLRKMKDRIRMLLCIIYAMTFDKDLFRELTVTLRSIVREDKSLVGRWDELFSRVNSQNFSDLANGLVVFNPCISRYLFEQCVLMLIATSLSPPPFTNAFFEPWSPVILDMNSPGTSVLDKFHVLHRVMTGFPRFNKEIDEAIMESGKIGINIYVIGGHGEEFFKFNNGHPKFFNPSEFV